MDDKQLQEYCEAWRQWCHTRKYFTPPGAKNILARMQPAKSGQPPDAVMSADLNFFNMAIHTLAGSAQCNGEAVCFVDQYWHQSRPVKSVAHKLGISRETYYQRSRRFARKALSLAASFKRLQEKQWDEQHGVQGMSETHAALALD